MCCVVVLMVLLPEWQGPVELLVPVKVAQQLLCHLLMVLQQLLPPAPPAAASSGSSPPAGPVSRDQAACRLSGHSSQQQAYGNNQLLAKQAISWTFTADMVWQSCL
jgi:hypothetical protein